MSRQPGTSLSEELTSNVPNDGSARSSEASVVHADSSSSEGEDDPIGGEEMDTSVSDDEVLPPQTKRMSTCTIGWMTHVVLPKQPPTIERKARVQEAVI